MTNPNQKRTSRDLSSKKKEKFGEQGKEREQRKRVEWKGEKKNHCFPNVWEQWQDQRKYQTKSMIQNKAALHYYYFFVLAFLFPGFRNEVKGWEGKKKRLEGG